jgi:hypothetical protein
VEDLFGITFAGTANSEGVLMKLAFAFEQATKLRSSIKNKNYLFLNQAQLLKINNIK